MKRNTFFEEKLKTLLGDCPFFDHAVCYDVLASTNDTAKELAASGLGEGTVILAESQTMGRGRMGRSFFSPQGSGLYMSVILRPAGKVSDPGLLTACAAVAVYQAILDMFDISVSIKWVNDLYAGGKKLCGILAEGHLALRPEDTYIVLGIGLNLAPPGGGYPEELQDIATSISEITGTNRLPDLTEICASVVRRWGELYEKLPDSRFLDIYRSASCVLGNEITYVKEGKKFLGKAVSIDDQARLVVLSEKGETQVLESGEVNFVRPVLL